MTYLTPPESAETLAAFYRKVRPEGPGWTAVAAQCGQPPPGSLLPHLGQWVLGCGLIYGTLFGAGKILFAEYPAGIVLLGLAGLCGWKLSGTLRSN